MLICPLKLMVSTSNHQLVTVTEEGEAWQGFGKYIGELLFRGEESNMKVTTSNEFSDEVIINLNVFRASMKHKVR